eukprot:scpid81817/ scgid2647/ 
MIAIGRQGRTHAAGVIAVVIIGITVNTRGTTGCSILAVQGVPRGHWQPPVTSLSSSSSPAHQRSTKAAPHARRHQVELGRRRHLRVVSVAPGDGGRPASSLALASPPVIGAALGEESDADHHQQTYGHDQTQHDAKHMILSISIYRSGERVASGRRYRLLIGTCLTVCTRNTVQHQHEQCQSVGTAGALRCCTTTQACARRLMCACCLQTCPRSTPHGPEQATLITDTGTGSGILAAVAVVTANTSQSSPSVADVSADAVDVAAAVPSADGATARSGEAAMTCTVAVVAATSGITCNAAGVIAAGVIAAGVIAAGVIAAAASAAAAAAG